MAHGSRSYYGPYWNSLSISLVNDKLARLLPKASTNSNSSWALIIEAFSCVFTPDLSPDTALALIPAPRTHIDWLGHSIARDLFLYWLCNFKSSTFLHGLPPSYLDRALIELKSKTERQNLLTLKFKRLIQLTLKKMID